MLAMMTALTGLLCVVASPSSAVAKEQPAVTATAQVQPMIVPGGCEYWDAIAFYEKEMGQVRCFHGAGTCSGVDCRLHHINEWQSAGSAGYFDFYPTAECNESGMTRLYFPKWSGGTIPLSIICRVHLDE
ncbi:hypothetical protein AORI_3325 [Amycolatopsis keratiniphila]|uniref:Secreted protein n=2 Tax=Amycolatopsis keratiniphila TaxID=129921 RepID=R4STQ4_9PSEU|nr:hypothetical protein AORI_3325 [Amycolatopsis keratiniphila]